MPRCDPTARRPSATPTGSRHPGWCRSDEHGRTMMDSAPAASAAQELPAAVSPGAGALRSPTSRRAREMAHPSGPRARGADARRGSPASASPARSTRTVRPDRRPTRVAILLVAGDRLLRRPLQQAPSWRLQRRGRFSTPARRRCRRSDRPTGPHRRRRTTEHVRSLLRRRWLMAREHMRPLELGAAGVSRTARRLGGRDQRAVTTRASDRTPARRTEIAVRHQHRHHPVAGKRRGVPPLVRPSSRPSSLGRVVSASDAIQRRDCHEPIETMRRAPTHGASGPTRPVASITTRAAQLPTLPLALRYRHRC